MIATSGGAFIPGSSADNLLDSPVTTYSAQDGGGGPIVRYAEFPYADCENWINVFGGECSAKRNQ